MFSKRSSFTLLEFLIALPLLALLSSFFLFYLSSFSTHPKKEQQLIREIKEAFYFKYRLRKLMVSLPRIQRDLKIEQGKLLFWANQGAYPNPKHSNLIQARLKLSNKCVLLQIYDTQKEPVLIREERYFKQIDSIDYLWGTYEEGEWRYKTSDCKPSAAQSLTLKVKKMNQNIETFIFTL